MGLVQHSSLQMPQYLLICPFYSVGTDIIAPISRCWRLSGGETYRQLVWCSVCPTVNSSENQSLKAQITDRTDGLKESTAKQTLPGCDARWTTRSPKKINIFNVFTWFLLISFEIHSYFSFSESGCCRFIYFIVIFLVWSFLSILQLSLNSIKYLSVNKIQNHSTFFFM